MDHSCSSIVKSIVLYTPQLWEYNDSSTTAVVVYRIMYHSCSSILNHVPQLQEYTESCTTAVVVY